MSWFGEPWPSADRRAPVCEDDAKRVDAPVGARCLWCDEPIEDGDRGETMTAIGENGPEVRYAHIECIFRQVMGGPAHLQGTCSCQGGRDDPDLGLSPREAAQKVWRAYVDGGLP